MFCWRLFLFFLCNIRAPLADRCEILHYAQKCVQFYNTGLKFRGGFPQKILRAKNMQIFGQISVDFKLQWRISPQPMKLFKSGKYILYCDSSRIG